MKDDLISRRMITAHLKQRLWETALNNVGIKCDADEIYSDIADNRLDSWMNEISSAQPELIEQSAYVRGLEQGRTQGMIDEQERNK